jgi:hypothetical protein
MSAEASVTEAAAPASEVLSPEACRLPDAPSSRPLVLPLLDDRVARRKFERQISDYRVMEAEYRKRGWFLLDATFPRVFVAFSAPHVALRPVLFGTVVDFTNHDYWPLSVRFVDPFTLTPLTIQDMPPMTRFRQEADGRLMPESLLVAHADQRPFLCIKGVREYHEHPFHSNDPWLPYRNSGVGTLVHVLEIIHRHSILPLSLNIQVQQVHFGWQLDPSRIPRSQ